MTAPKTSLLPATGLALLLMLGACAKKEEATVAPAAAADGAAFQRAQPAPEQRSRVTSVGEGFLAEPSAPPAEGILGSVSSATPQQQMASSAATYTDGERKFIRTASADFSVKDVYVAALAIEDTVAAHGGFVVSNDISTEILDTRSFAIGDGKLMELKEVQVNGELTVRVPSEKTQEFLRAIVAHVVVLDSRNVSARDAQFDMLRRQLDMARNHEAQADLGDAIDSGGRLGQKAYAISERNAAKAARDEALLAKKVFEDQVAFSTITLSIKQPAKVLRAEAVDVVGVFQQNRPGFFTRLGQSMRGGWDGFMNMLVWMATLWPLLVIAAVGATVAWRFKRGARKVPLNPA